MSTGYQIKDQSAPYFLTLQIVNWIDVFTRKVYKDIIIDSLKFCQRVKHLEIYGFVVMSNHIHLIARSGSDDLSGLLRDFKKFTSKKITEVVDSPQESRRKWMLKLFEFEAMKRKKVNKMQLWTHENHAIELYSNAFIIEKLDYIHANPVKVGIVEYPEQYLYSSARNYAGLPGVLDIVELSRAISTY